MWKMKWYENLQNFNIFLQFQEKIVNIFYLEIFHTNTFDVQLKTPL